MSNNHYSNGTKVLAIVLGCSLPLIAAAIVTFLTHTSNTDLHMPLSTKMQTFATQEHVDDKMDAVEHRLANIEKAQREILDELRMIARKGQIK
jgi:hypothetical protein